MTSTTTLPDPELTTPEPGAQARSQRFVGLTLLAGIIAALIVLALLSWMAHEMLEGEMVTFDDAVRNGVHILAGAGMTRFMRAISFFGGPTALAPLGALFALWFYHRGWKRAAALLPLTLIGAALLDGVLKYSFARARPAPFFGYPLPASYSFPSGHAMFGFCFFTVLAALASPRVKRSALRTAIWVVAVGASFLIGLSRIYLGVHYPSDVVAGWGTGFVWVVIVAFGDRVAHRIKRGQA